VRDGKVAHVAVKTEDGLEVVVEVVRVQVRVNVYRSDDVGVGVERCKGRV
jgi:hypothetical protein